MNKLEALKKAREIVSESLHIDFAHSKYNIDRLDKAIAKIENSKRNYA